MKVPWICAGDTAYAMGVARGDQPWLCPWASPSPASRTHAEEVIWFGKVRFRGRSWRRSQHPALGKAQIIQRPWGLFDPAVPGQYPCTAFALSQ